MSKRIKSVDIMRGLMIFYVIILHPLIQRVFSQNTSMFETQMNSIPLFIIIIGIPFILISLWGTLFTFLSGFSTAYQMRSKISSESTTIGDLKRILRTRLINSSLLIVCHFICISFFLNMSQEYTTHSILTGSLETGIFGIPTGIHFLTSSTLEAIAITGILISLILYICFQPKIKNGVKTINFKRAYYVLSAITLIVLGVSLIFEHFVQDPLALGDSIMANSNIFVYFLYTRFFEVRFSIFPVFAFGSVGAIFGLKIAEGKKVRDVLFSGLRLGLYLISVFFIFLLNGFDVIKQFASEHVPVPLQFLNLGLQLIILMGLFYLFDHNTKTQMKFKRTRKIIDRYNANSLTIFILEPFISIIYYQIFVFFNHGPIDENLGLIVLFIGLIVATWFLILKMWAKINYKYNFEWGIAYFKNKITKYWDGKLKNFEEKKENLPKVFQEFPFFGILISNLPETLLRNINLRECKFNIIKNPLIYSS